MPTSRPQQAHVVVDFRNRADSRARIFRRCLLLDGDGRRQSVDLIDVRLLHHLEELAGVSGQRFNVAALSLGVDGVKRERRFARARQPREHDELVARISRSTFLRLCSRAPRIVIARRLDAVLRLALITSSIKSFPVTRRAQTERHLRKRGETVTSCSARFQCSEHRKNG